MNPLSKTDHELLLSYLDNQLTDTESAQMERRLRTEPSLAEWLIRLAQDEAVMAEWATTRTVAPPLGRSRRWVYVWAGSAAALLIAISYWLIHFPKPQEQELRDALPAYAQLEEVQGEAFLVTENGETTPVTVGQELKPGQQIRTGEGGVAVVRLPFLGRVELGTDTTVRILPPESVARVHVEKGTIHADSTNPINAPPMSFTTPHALIRASGSTVITSTMGNSSAIEMDTGSAQVINSGDGKTIDVSAGKFTITQPNRANNQAVKSMPPRTTFPRETWNYPAGPTVTGTMLPGGNIFYFSTWDARLVLRDIQNGQELADIRDGTKKMKALGISADGSTLVTGSDDKLIKVREVQTGKELLTLKKQKLEIQCLAVSPDGKTFATGSGTVDKFGELKIWDPKSGLELANLKGHTRTIESVAFSPDGRWLASASRDGGARLWNTTNWQSTGDVTSHPQGALCVAFTPDSKNLISAGRDGYIRIWDIEKQELVGELDPPPHEIAALAVSPDGRYLASGVGGSIWIWNLATKQSIQTLAGHKHKVTSVSFSADGKSLYSTGWDRTVKVWDLLNP